MLKLKSSSPSAVTLQHLATQQADVDSQPAAGRASRANALWNAKRGRQPGQAAFEEVKQVLFGLCVGTGLCNYCEQSEASDIEHIYPKSFFPERAFQWSNYLLACKECNTAYKLDQFAVFAPAQSASAVALRRRRRPPSADAAFIDPRVEDPMQYLWLSMGPKDFFLIAHPDLEARHDLRAVAKARHTLAVLQIGTRPSVAAGRKVAFGSYQRLLEQYQKIRDATTWDDLEQLTDDPHRLDKSNSFAAEQQSRLDNLKQSILTHPHPTVWREMQRQYQQLRKTKKLFEDVPEALTWV